MLMTKFTILFHRVCRVGIAVATRHNSSNQSKALSFPSFLTLPGALRCQIAAQCLPPPPPTDQQHDVQALSCAYHLQRSPIVAVAVRRRFLWRHCSPGLF
jgi:hypothetical protein